jgi:hypothetical protein
MSPDVFDEALATIKAAVAGVQAEIRQQDAALAERETRIAGLEATAKDLAAVPDEVRDQGEEAWSSRARPTQGCCTSSCDLGRASRSAQAAR